MTNQLKSFYKSAIQCLQREGVGNPVKVLSPLIQNINHSQYSKLTGHINTASSIQLNYSNQSEGYNEGFMKAIFEFPTSKSKMYQFDFSSKLSGDYGTTEWWLPLVSTSMTEDVGNTMAFKGMQIDFDQFTIELKREINNEIEINMLKQNIAEMQRQLASMTKAS